MLSARFRLSLILCAFAHLSSFSESIAASKKETTKTTDETSIVKKKAKPPTLNLSGFSAVYMSSTKQKIRLDNLGGPGLNGHLAIGSAALSMSILGESDNDTEYGYILEFEPTSTADPFVTRNYIQVGHEKWGRFQLGTVKGAEHIMYNGPWTIIGPGAGLDGAMWKLFTHAAGAIKAQSMLGESNKATKISYYTPRIYGFQVGLSYTPHTSHIGDEPPLGYNGISGNDKSNYSELYFDKKMIAPFGQKNVAIAVNFTKGYQKWIFSLGGSYIRDDTKGFGYGREHLKVHPVRAFKTYVSLSYDKFTIGAGYLNNRKSRLPNTNIGKPITNIYDSGFSSNIDRAIEQISDNAGNQAIADITATALAFASGAQSYFSIDANQKDAGQAWSLASSYVWGPLKLAVGYHRATCRPLGLLISGDQIKLANQTLPAGPVTVGPDPKNRAVSEVLTLRTDFMVRQGFKLFAEVDVLRSRTSQSAVMLRQKMIDAAGGIIGETTKSTQKNRGAVFIIGTAANF